MYENLIKYRITPRVVQADKKQTIKIEGLDKSSRFYDDMEYTVKITPIEDGWGYVEDKDQQLYGRDTVTEITAKCKDGVVFFEHFFKGECEWKITVAPASDKHLSEWNNRFGWVWRSAKILAGVDFRVYSLGEDLYGKRPFKGDLHVHTMGSDGDESGVMVAAQYRKFGFDFISITDHYTMKPSFETVEAFSEIPTPFKLFPGEEVHPMQGGIFHIVNFNGKDSVNDIAHETPEIAQEEVRKIAETLDIEDESIRTEIAWFTWINENIHKMGGITIYAHPYWVNRDSYVIRNSVIKEVLKRKLFDAIEILGGNERKYNLQQVQMYYDYCNTYGKVPPVGSSDSHSALSHGESFFDDSWTVVFSEDAEKIPENLLSGNSVAVDNFDVKNKNVYGDLRLTRYTWFLIENYFENHDALCNAAGQAILRRVQGDKTQDSLIIALENELKKYNTIFFGKEK